MRSCVDMLSGSDTNQLFGINQHTLDAKWVDGTHNSKLLGDLYSMEIWGRGARY